MKLSKILADNKRMMMLPVALAELLVEVFGTEASVLFSCISSTGDWSVHVQEANGDHQHVHGKFDGDGYRF